MIGMRPFHATMANCSGLSSFGSKTTLPPAASTSKTPAATSQMDMTLPHRRQICRRQYKPGPEPQNRYCAPCVPARRSWRNVQSPFLGTVRLAVPHEYHGFRHAFPPAAMHGMIIHVRNPALFHMPAFIHHGIVNHAQHHFPAAAQSYGDAEPGNRVK